MDLEELKNVVGKHTELVTVYVPAGYEKHRILSQLKQEKETASNIKSKGTRKNVLVALEKAIRAITDLEVPKEGLAVFSS